MKKQVKKFSVDYNLEWEYGVKISKLREDLDAIEKLGATHVDIDAYESYGCAKVTIEGKAERIETNEEFKSRLNELKIRQTQQENRELEQFLKLKQKYGLKNES